MLYPNNYDDSTIATIIAMREKNKVPKFTAERENTWST